MLIPLLFIRRRKGTEWKAILFVSCKEQSKGVEREREGEREREVWKIKGMESSVFIEERCGWHSQPSFCVPRIRMKTDYLGGEENFRNFVFGFPFWVFLMGYVS